MHLIQQQRSNWRSYREVTEEVTSNRGKIKTFSQLKKHSKVSFWLNQKMTIIKSVCKTTTTTTNVLARTEAGFCVKNWLLHIPYRQQNCGQTKDRESVGHNLHQKKARTGHWQHEWNNSVKTAGTFKPVISIMCKPHSFCDIRFLSRGWSKSYRRGDITAQSTKTNYESGKAMMACPIEEEGGEGARGGLRQCSTSVTPNPYHFLKKSS